MPPESSTPPRYSHPRDSPLRASVIVTTYNRPERLRRMLRALVAQDLPLNEFEVVIVDDGSPQPIAPVAEAFMDRLQITLHRQPNSGPAVGRNTAISLARSRFIVMLDDDCEPAPSWLSILVAALEANPEAMVGGHTMNGLPDNLYSAVSQMIVDRVYAVHNAEPAKAGFFTSSNLGVSRELLVALGSFDTDYRLAGGEDRGLSDRWRNSGHAMIYVAAATIFHFHELDLRRYLRQHFNYGRGALHYHRTRVTSHAGEAKTARGIVFDFTAWRSLIRERRGPHSTFAIIALLFLWQAANTAGYFWEAMARGSRILGIRAR